MNRAIRLLPLLDQIAYCLFTPLQLPGYPEVSCFQVVKQGVNQHWQSELAFVH
jgi:hypothetical protein